MIKHIKEENLQEIINHLGLGPADYHKKSIMEKYLQNFWKNFGEYKNNEEDFRRSIIMALYTLDGIKDTNKIILVDQPNFTHEEEFFQVSAYQTSWKGNIEELKALTEEGVMFKQIRELIDELNKEDITKIFIYELFSHRVTSRDIESYDPQVEIKFLSRFLVEKKELKKLKKVTQIKSFI